MYRVTSIRVVAFRGMKAKSVTRKPVRADTEQSPNVSMLGQRRIGLTGIVPAIGCDIGPKIH